MSTLPFQEIAPLTAIATSLQLRDRVKQAFYVGIDMRSPTHDYQKTHYILMHFRAEKMSPRIWMIVVDLGDEALVLSLLKKCVAAGDEVLIAKAPAAPEVTIHEPEAGEPERQRIAA